MPPPPARPGARPSSRPSDRPGLLRRFRRDVSGNALAIMAAAVLPMTAAVGGAIDISRNYMAKSRLQQACDAGVLAGRKTQGGKTWGSDAEREADNYFAVNYPNETYGSRDITFEARPVDTSEVQGDATVFVPSTIGRVVGYQGQKLGGHLQRQAGPDQHRRHVRARHVGVHAQQRRLGRHPHRSFAAGRARLRRGAGDGQAQGHAGPLRLRQLRQHRQCRPAADRHQLGPGRQPPRLPNTSVVPRTLPRQRLGRGMRLQRRHLLGRCLHGGGRVPARSAGT